MDGEARTHKYTLQWTIRGEIHLQFQQNTFLLKFGSFTEELKIYSNMNGAALRQKHIILVHDPVGISLYRQWMHQAQLTFNMLPLL